MPEEVDLHFKPTLEDHAVPPADHDTGRPSYGWVSPLHVRRLCPSISAEPSQQGSAAVYFLKNTPRKAFQSLPFRSLAEEKQAEQSPGLLPQKNPPAAWKLQNPPRLNGSHSRSRHISKYFLYVFMRVAAAPCSGYYPAHKKE